MSKEEILQMLDEIDFQCEEEIIEQLREWIKDTPDSKIVQKAKGLSKDEIKDILIAKATKLKEKQPKFTDINAMFTYGVTEDCVHLHILPKDIHEIFGNSTSKMKIVKRWS